jgi:hypothetical protein
MDSFHDRSSQSSDCAKIKCEFRITVFQRSESKEDIKNEFRAPTIFNYTFKLLAALNLQDSEGITWLWTHFNRSSAVLKRRRQSHNSIPHASLLRSYMMHHRLLGERTCVSFFFILIYFKSFFNLCWESTPLKRSVRRILSLLMRNSPSILRECPKTSNWTRYFGNKHFLYWRSSICTIYFWNKTWSICWSSRVICDVSLMTLEF